MKAPVRTLLATALLPALLAGCGGGGGDNRGILSFVAVEFSVGEDGTPIAAITVQRLGGDGPVGATILVSGLTATPPGDFDPSPLTVTWDAGDVANKTVAVIILDDVVDEPDETVHLQLANPTGGATIRAPLDDATLRIVDDDVAGTIQFSAPAYLYGEDGTPFGPVVTVQRVGGKDGIVTATLSSADQTATSDPASPNEPLDYAAVAQAITFVDQDATPRVIPLASAITQDVLPESVETFELFLSDPTGGALVGAPATVTLFDDDAFLEIPNPGPTPGGNFGAAAAKLGKHLLIGAPGNAAGSGRVYVFDPANGMLLDTISRPFATQFGRTIAVRGDTLAIAGNGNVWVLDATDLTDRFVLSSSIPGFGDAMFLTSDGRLVVGAPQAPSGGPTPAGALRVFDELTGAPLQSLDGGAGQELGAAFAQFGGDLLAGAPGGMGAVLQLSGNPFALALLIANPVAEAPPPRFGARLAVLDDTVFYVGAPDGDSGPLSDAGRVDRTNAGGFLSTAIPIAGARFGANLLVVRDKVCIQAPGDGPMGSGRVHVYDETFDFSYFPIDDPAPDANEDFGGALCEFDGALVVGAPFKDASFAPGQGTVWVFRLPESLE